MPACLRLVSIEIWDWRPAPFYPQISSLKFVDNLELTATFSVGWTDFTGFSCFACCSRRLKIKIFNAYGRVSTAVPSFAANKEDRNFGVEKG